MREGFVQVRHGSGTFARELVLDYALQRRTRMTENLAEAGERAAREVLEHWEADAAPWAAELRVPADSRVVVLTTRATVRGRPVGLSVDAYPLPRFAGLPALVGEHGRVTLALQALDVRDYTRARSVVSARLPTARRGRPPGTAGRAAGAGGQFDRRRRAGHADPVGRHPLRGRCGATGRPARRGRQVMSGALAAGADGEAAASSSARHAIYWAPDLAHPLWSAGCDWLGRDAAAPAREIRTCRRRGRMWPRRRATASTRR